MSKLSVEFKVSSDTEVQASALKGGGYRVDVHEDVHGDGVALYLFFESMDDAMWFFEAAKEAVSEEYAEQARMLERQLVYEKSLSSSK